MTCVELGLLSYQEGLEKQQEYFSKKYQSHDPEDYLLLLEHTPVFTFGKRDSSKDLLVQEKWLKTQGFDVVKSDRGGRVTYHGPGQIVGYLIVSLKESIPKFVSHVEDVLIATLLDFGIQGDRDAQYPGVWVGKNKIAAIGMRIEHGISRHGFSLNVSCDLDPYQYVNPCGITAHSNRSVTSIWEEITKRDGIKPSLSQVKKSLQKHITDFL